MCQNCSESKLLPIFLYRSQSQRPRNYITSTIIRSVWKKKFKHFATTTTIRYTFIYSLITTNSQQANLASVSLDLQMHFSEIISQEKVSTEVGGYTPENLQLHPNDLHVLFLFFFALPLNHCPIMKTISNENVPSQLQEEPLGCTSESLY